jgi:hypothetical protein
MGGLPDFNGTVLECTARCGTHQLGSLRKSASLHLLLLLMMRMMKCKSIYSMQVETNKCESRRRVREGISLRYFLKL